MDFHSLILLAPGILAALTFHEFAHGWVAWRLGDDTAKDQGRLTLNPLSHLDPIGTLMLFIVHFGWAKPVPVNPYNLGRSITEMRRGMVWVSLAGPAANVLLAAILGIAVRAVLTFGLVDRSSFILPMLLLAVFINLMLAFFNLIPIPPLDGSKIVGGLLPLKYLSVWENFERRGVFVLLGIILISWLLHIPIFSYFISPPVNTMFSIFTGLDPSLIFG